MLQDFKKHLMTGISYMIPMVVAGGILGALAKGLGGWEVGNLAPDASGATIFSYLNAFDCDELRLCRISSWYCIFYV